MSTPRMCWIDPFDWWLSTAAWKRYAVGLGLIAASTIPVFWGRISFSGLALGFILLAVASSSKAEKNGYHF